MRIMTEYVRPPIPTRECDYSAIDVDRYDGDGCPIGRGATATEAVTDLAATAGAEYTEAEMAAGLADARQRADTMTILFCEHVRALLTPRPAFRDHAEEIAWVQQQHAAEGIR